MSKLNQDANGNKLLNQDSNGVIWVKSDSGAVFGVVDQLVVLDEGGLKYEKDTLSVLEESGFELDQNWDDESTYIDFTHENGEISKVVFLDSKVKLI